METKNIKDIPVQGTEVVTEKKVTDAAIERSVQQFRKHTEILIRANELKEEEVKQMRNLGKKLVDNIMKKKYGI